MALHNWVRDATVLHATSSGKVLLAHLPPAQRETVLGTALERFGAHRASVLRRQLEQVVERGWALAEEFEEG